MASIQFYYKNEQKRRTRFSSHLEKMKNPFQSLNLSYITFLFIFLQFKCIHSEEPPWKLKNLPPTPPIIPLSGIFSTSYIDIYGRERYFRGLNVVVKGPPWYPLIEQYDRHDSFNLDDIQYLSWLNINLIRLGIMWPGVEPKRGVYNQTYLDIMKEIFKLCHQHVSLFLKYYFFLEFLTY
jgi:hypothetical protein